MCATGWSKSVFAVPLSHGAGYRETICARSVRDHVRRGACGNADGQFDPSAGSEKVFDAGQHWSDRNSIVFRDVHRPGRDFFVLAGSSSGANFSLGSRCATSDGSFGFILGWFEAYCSTMRCLFWLLVFLFSAWPAVAGSAEDQNRPPTIKHEPVTVAVRGQPITILANVTDDSGLVKSVTLFYSPPRMPRRFARP